MDIGLISSCIVDVELRNTSCHCEDNAPGQVQAAIKPANITPPFAAASPDIEETRANSPCLCSVAPFGIPETLRISDIEVGRYDGNGVWLTLFMNTTGPESEWTSWQEYVKT